MSKDFKINSIFDALDPSHQTDKPEQFVYFLGTDTKFTPGPTRDDPDLAKRKLYERGELQSHAAQVVAQELDEQGQYYPGASLSYSSPSVDVLDGPNTLATNVGDKIAEGIYLVLYAVALGKKLIQITAHSRGACEAILVMHELARIRKALRAEPQKSLFAIFLETPCLYTQRALRKIFQDTALDTLEKRAQLLERLDSLTINSVLVDPVPGTGMGVASWNDERFYWPLDAENNFDGEHLVLLMRDESSALFAPIGVSESERVQRLLHPGTHANCTGNQYSHKYHRPAGMEAADLSGAQDLALYHLFEFYSKTTNLFKRRVVFNTAHPELDRCLNAFLLVGPAERAQLYYELYTAINEQKELYQWLSKNSSYTSVNRGKRGRYVLINDQYAEMGDIFPEVPRDFINSHHVSIFLNRVSGIHMEGRGEPELIVNHIGELIEKFFSVMALEAFELEPSELAQLLDNEVGQDCVCNCIKTLVNKVGVYLVRGLTEDQKNKLMLRIKEVISNLKEKRLFQDKKAQQLREKLQKILRVGLKEVIDQHTQSLLLQASELKNQVIILASIETVFAAELACVISSLDKYLSSGADAEQSESLRILKTLVEGLQVEPVANLEALQARIGLLVPENTTPEVICQVFDVIYSAYSPKFKCYAEVYARIQQEFDYEKALSQLLSEIQYRRDNLENLRMLASDSDNPDPSIFNVENELQESMRSLEQAEQILKQFKAAQEAESERMLAEAELVARIEEEELMLMKKSLDSYSKFWRVGRTHKESVKDLLANFNKPGYKTPVEIISHLDIIIDKEKAKQRGELFKLTAFFKARQASSGSRLPVQKVQVTK